MGKKEELLTKEQKYKLLQMVCYDVIKDISTVSHEAIDKFYEDYTPQYYKRTYGLKNLFSVKFRIANNCKGAVVMFKYSSEYITTEHNGSNKDVFNYNFIMGYHGGEYFGPYPSEHNYKNPFRMKPSPWTYIYHYVDKHYSLIKEKK